MLKSLIGFGRTTFALAVAALGLLCFVYSAPVAGLEPLPESTFARSFWVYGTGVILIGAGVCIFAGKGVRLAAASLGIMSLLWVLILHAPNLFARPSNGNVWTVTFETLALCGVAWVLAGSRASGQTSSEKWRGRSSSPVTPARICFGVSMLVFGVLHFIYARFVATLVPAWLPGRLFWACFTGAAFIAAGASMVTGVKARLAATLLGFMFGAWVLILHAPRVAAAPHDRREWTSLLIASAMCGGAWLVAENITPGKFCERS